MPPESSQTNERPSAPRRRQRALTEEELKDIQEKRLKGNSSGCFILHLVLTRSQVNSRVLNAGA